MEIQSVHNKIVIKGNIKSVQHYQALKREIDTLIKNAHNIQIHIIDSISITSSIIGYLCKIAEKEGISCSLYVKNRELYSLLEELNLSTLLNIQKI